MSGVVPLEIERGVEKDHRKLLALRQVLQNRGHFIGIGMNGPAHNGQVLGMLVVDLLDEAAQTLGHRCLLKPPEYGLGIARR